MKVAKFGGSSLADAAQIEKVCAIVKSDPERRVLVVSAPGKRSANDTKVTDLLIKLAEAALSGGDVASETAAVIDRFNDIRVGLGLKGDDGTDLLRADLIQRLDLPKAPRERFMDAIKAAGEDYCARLVADALRARGVEAVYIAPGEAGMLLGGDFGDGQVLPGAYARLADALKGRSEVVVFPGFFGATSEGDIITFSRGGSDITGAILAAALSADEYENFTDVDGVYCVDPRLVPEARPIPELTYRELRELAYSGFNVFHEEAVIPAIRQEIPIHIRNTNHPEAFGTRITANRQFRHGEAVGIAGMDGFCAIFLSKFLMNREIGFGRRVLTVLEEEGLSYEHIPSGIDNLSIILESHDLTTSKEQRVLERFLKELNVDAVEIDRDLALIMIVGEGMHYTVGLAARATGALARAGINIEMLNQGSSEISMMFGVKAGDRAKAVRVLFDAFFGECQS